MPDISHDTVRHILNFCDHAAITACEHVCKNWQQIAKQVWNDLFFKIVKMENSIPLIPKYAKHHVCGTKMKPYQYILQQQNQAVMTQVHVWHCFVAVAMDGQKEGACFSILDSTCMDFVVYKHPIQVQHAHTIQVAKIQLIHQGSKLLVCVAGTSISRQSTNGFVFKYHVQATEKQECAVQLVEQKTHSLPVLSFAILPNAEFHLTFAELYMYMNGVPLIWVMKPDVTLVEEEEAFTILPKLISHFGGVLQNAQQPDSYIIRIVSTLIKNPLYENRMEDYELSLDKEHQQWKLKLHHTVDMNKIFNYFSTSPNMRYIAYNNDAEQIGMYQRNSSGKYQQLHKQPAQADTSDNEEEEANSNSSELSGSIVDNSDDEDADSTYVFDGAGTILAACIDNDSQYIAITSHYQVHWSDLMAHEMNSVRQFDLTHMCNALQPQQKQTKMQIACIPNSQRAVILVHVKNKSSLFLV